MHDPIKISELIVLFDYNYNNNNGDNFQQKKIYINILTLGKDYFPVKMLYILLSSPEVQ